MDFATGKKRQLRQHIVELEAENEQLKERIRDWDRVRSRVRDHYLDLADVLDLPKLPEAPKPVVDKSGPDYLRQTVRRALIGLDKELELDVVCEEEDWSE